ncbi:uncharacterized protein LOC123272203 [Cotesia glomerata]|uniref:uncharacterized protein LOC123272203 n=1 Tax=Cotesia glomerata TaxID=32391 RepID=UPI001D029CA4|nr:uncharacterized protein LOC123272203 [Cotesia glomerata]
MRFWEIEELPSTSKILSPEEKACEEHFSSNKTRDASGRYVVRLPFNEKIHLLGNSYSTALKRFSHLESRLHKDPKLLKDYSTFLTEYEQLKHMSISQESDINSGFYLPHHAVIKADSTTTKTQVVFDGSCKTSTGISLNDTLMVGPKLQDNLFVILIRYRSHIYALTADIEKMYRQILVHPDDVKYQKILFRESGDETIKIYTLNTVTYGTSAGSYLAIKSLQQLGKDKRKSYPNASVVL